MYLRPKAPRDTGILKAKEATKYLKVNEQPSTG